MNIPTSLLTKVCSSCGQTKPLSAYLQLNDENSAIYGNICATCRKTAMLNETHESTTSTSGHKIDAKAKIYGETDKRQYRKQLEENYRENKNKKEINTSIISQKASDAAKNEKKHRSQYLHKHDFLAKKNKSPTSTPVAFGGEQHIAKEQKINLTDPVVDTHISGKEKYKSALFDQFTAWLGESAPIVQAIKQNQLNPSAKKTSLVDYVKKTWRKK